MLNPKNDSGLHLDVHGCVRFPAPSNVASIDTKALSAGTYTVKGHVSQGMKPGQFADCSATFTVTAFQPPTVGCSANPSTVNVGDPSTITANGVSPQNRPLTYSYSATAGSISGNTSTATLSTTTGVAPGTIYCDLQRSGRQGPERFADDDGHGVGSPDGPLLRS